MSKSLREVALLLASSFAGAFFAFIIQAILARNLGPAEYGVFSSSLSTATIAATLMCFGIPQLLLRTFGKYGQPAISVTPPALKLVAVCTASVAVLTTTWAFNGPHPKSTSIIISLLVLHSICLCAIEIACVKYQLEGNYRTFSKWQLAPNIARLAAITPILFLQKEATAQTIALAYSLVALLVLAISAHPISRLSTGKISLEGHGESESDTQQIKKSISNVLYETTPLGLFGLLNIIYFQSGIVLVNYLASPEEAGQYSVAFSIMMATYLFPTVIYQKYLLPKLHRWINHDPKKFDEIYRKGNLYMMALGTSAMCSIWVLSEILIPMVFGQEYKHSAKILNLLAVCAPVQFLISSVSASLLNHSSTKHKVICLAIASIANVALSLLLIPSMGAEGAAFSSIGSSILLLGMYHTYARTIKLRLETN